MAGPGWSWGLCQLVLGSPLHMPTPPPALLSYPRLLAQLWPPKMLLWACSCSAGVTGLSSSGHSQHLCPAVPHAVWPQRMNSVGGEGWASLCSILTCGQLRLEVEGGFGTANFAVPHSDFASCFSHLSAWWDLFQHLHPSSICPFPRFYFVDIFPHPRCELCLLWVGQ